MRKFFMFHCFLLILLLTSCSTHDALPQQNMGSSEESQIVETPTFDNVVATYEVDDEYVVVQTQKETYAPRFQLWNKKTNQVDTFPTMPDFVELKDIVASDCFVFLTTGRGSESVRLDFPHMITCFKVENADEPFICIDTEKRFSLSETVTAGTEISCELSAVNFSFGGASFMFAPSPGNETAFYADAPDIPLTSITYEEETNALFISLSSCSFNEKKSVIDDVCLSMNPYIDDYRISQREDATVISLILSDKASGYYAEKDFSFEPFFTLQFSK